MEMCRIYFCLNQYVTTEKYLQVLTKNLKLALEKYDR